MPTFLIENLSTILVSGVILTLVIIILYKMKKDKKKGSCSCGSSCSGCPGSSKCSKD